MATVRTTIRSRLTGKPFAVVTDDGALHITECDDPAFIANAKFANVEPTPEKRVRRLLGTSIYLVADPFKRT